MKIRVCRDDELPNQGVHSFQVAGLPWPVLLTRIDGEVYAASSRCPHADVSLANGTFEDGAIRCPGHGYEFDFRTGQCQHDELLSMTTYRVSMVDDDIHIHLVTWSRLRRPKG